MTFSCFLSFVTCIILLPFLLKRLSKLCFFICWVLDWEKNVVLLLHFVSACVFLLENDGRNILQEVSFILLFFVQFWFGGHTQRCSSLLLCLRNHSKWCLGDNRLYQELDLVNTLNLCPISSTYNKQFDTYSFSFSVYSISC